MADGAVVKQVVKNHVTGNYRTVRRRLSSIKPSPENEQLYNPITADDLEIEKLAASIKKRGLHEPLIITEDGFIVSGHRRFTALKSIEQVVVACRILPGVRRDRMVKDQYIALLREHNRQRYKSVAEQIREELVDISPADAHKQLVELRQRSVYSYNINGVRTLEIEGAKRRSAISDQKADHVKFVKQIVYQDRRSYWPLSIRGVHYALLNYSFLRNIPQEIAYKNDPQSYQATSDLITRLRLNGELPWKAFDDTTRPITLHNPFDNVREFIRQEMDNLFTGYWRKLLQTQPNHVEVVCEKNTVYHMALRVTDEFQIPTLSGRGFNSIDPWHDLFERYIASGKQRLIVIVLSDFDPEGELIPHVGGRTLRDDFGVQDLEIIKAGVTREQIEKYNLPQQNFAKEESNNHQWFVDRNGGDGAVYELEALEPEVMISDLRNVITGVLDMSLFNAEVAREQAEAVHLSTARNTAKKALRGIDL